jgi:hypothetical protein
MGAADSACESIGGTMNCFEAEQLFDAYLDRQLSGSLRLELEAHRLRCVRCQQALALAEACQSIIAADSDVPALRDDFTARVMSEVRDTARGGRPKRRWLIAAASVVLPAAAALALLSWNARFQAPSAGPPPVVVDASPSGDIDRAIRARDFVALYDGILELKERKMATLAAAGQNVTNDALTLLQLPMNIAVPADMAGVAPVNPLLLLFRDMLPPAEHRDEAELETDDARPAYRL